MQGLDEDLVIRSGNAFAVLGVASLILGLVVGWFSNRSPVEDRESRRFVRVVLGIAAFQTIAFLAAGWVLIRTAYGRTLPEFLLISAPAMLAGPVWLIGARYLVARSRSRPGGT